MNKDKINNNSKNSIKEKIIISVMIIYVLFGLYNTIHSWVKMHNQEWRAKLPQERIANPKRLVVNTDQHFFITNIILPLLKIINETPNIDLASIQQNCLEKNDLNISLYLFDINSNLEEVVPKRAPNQWLIKKL